MHYNRVQFEVWTSPMPLAPDRVNYRFRYRRHPTTGTIMLQREETGPCVLFGAKVIETPADSRLAKEWTKVYDLKLE